jgi:predicted  nucleic acid-binding Zn ribbon protein
VDCNHNWQLAGTMYTVRFYRCRHCKAIKLEIILTGR